jgi:hypothetical protein
MLCLFYITLLHWIFFPPTHTEISSVCLKCFGSATDKAKFYDYDDLYFPNHHTKKEPQTFGGNFL